MQHSVHSAKQRARSFRRGARGGGAGPVARTAAKGGPGMEGNWGERSLPRFLPVPPPPPPHLLPMSTFPLPHYMCFSSPFIFRCVVCSKTCMTLHLRRIGNARPTGQRESPLGRLPGGGRCAWPKMYVLKLARYRNSNNICGVNFMPLIEGKITVSIRKIFAGLLR